MSNADIRGSRFANADDLNAFYKLHFGDATYDGNVFIQAKLKLGSFEKPTAVAISGLKSYLEKQQFRDDKNYYLTANDFKNPYKRRRYNLFTLKNLVIDIDCHELNLSNPMAMRNRCNQLVDTLFTEVFIDDVVPCPNSVVYTGRGVQLWWAIETTYIKPLKKLESTNQELKANKKAENNNPEKTADSEKSREVKNFTEPRYSTKEESLILLMSLQTKGYWCAIFEEVIERNSELACFKVDRTASKNAVGLYRLPGTYNQKTKTLVTVKNYSMNTYNPRELWDKDYNKYLEHTRLLIRKGKVKDFKKYCQEFTSTPRCAFSNDEAALFAGITSCGALNRCKAVVALRKRRNAPVGAEYRDMSCFILYNTYRFAGLDDVESVRRVILFNKGFKQPLSENELLNYLGSAREKGGYKMTNATIIDMLNITKDEQVAIKLAPISAYNEVLSRNEYKKMVRKENKIERIGHILAYHMTGLNNTQIASKVKDSRPTVIKYVHEYETNSIDKEYVEMAERIIRGWDEENLKKAQETKAHEIETSKNAAKKRKPRKDKPLMRYIHISPEYFSILPANESSDYIEQIAEPKDADIENLSYYVYADCTQRQKNHPQGWLCDLYPFNLLL